MFTFRGVRRGGGDVNIVYVVRKGGREIKFAFTRVSMYIHIRTVIVGTKENLNFFAIHYVRVSLILLKGKFADFYFIYFFFSKCTTRLYSQYFCSRTRTRR